MRYGPLVIGLGVMFLASVLIAGSAWALDDPAGIMRLYVELPDWVIDPTDTSNGPASRFGMQALTGDPTTLNDDNKIIASVVDPTNNLNTYSSITTISIDNTDVQATDTVMADLSTIQDGGGREFWPLPPTERTRDVVYRMLVGIDDNDPSQAVEVIEVYAQLVLLRDTLKLDFILTNRGTMSHKVGLRHFIDCQFGGGLQQNDGTFIVLSDGGMIDTETVLRSPNTPDAWVSFDNINNPTVVLRGTIKGGEVEDPGTATYSAGPPDQVEFGQRINMGNDDQFDFTPTSTFTLTGEDWGAATRWDEETLAVGASRRYVTYYGLGGSTSDFTPPYVLASYAPFQLQVVEGDDPITADVEEAYLADDSGSSIWNVRAYCDNFGAGSIVDARATLTLPPGLELDDTQGLQSRTVLLGTIARNTQASTLWRVRATAAAKPGVHEITVSGPLGRTVTRKINIPALPTLSQDGLNPLHAVSMVSLPYTFLNTDAEHVFESLGSLQSNDAALVRWDPSASPQPQYWFFPNGPSGFVTNIQPGTGYWLLNRQLTTIQLPTDRQLVPPTDPYPISLPPGWNQIGCPFTSTVRFDQVKIVGSDGIERSVTEAGTAGLIVPTIYAYDTGSGQYTFHNRMRDMVLEPYVGYWLLVLRPITLIFPVPTIMPFEAPPTSSDPASAEGWRVPLVVKAGNLVRTDRALGAAESSADGVDLADVMCPPPAAAPNGARLDAYFLCEGWGARSGRYYTDIRSARPGTQGWTFVVDTDMPGQPISISWPDLSQMPANLIATLEDVQTGRVRFMRTTTSYTFNSGQGGPRQFRVLIAERGPAALQIMGFSCAPTANGVQMTYTLNAPASVDVVVRNIAGRVVKRLCQSRPTPAGESVVTWTGAQENGLPAPNGAYVVSIVAKSPEGERTGLLRTVYYHR